jgi:hypothetical protein
MRSALNFLTDIDPTVGLASAPGSLMVDVFIRANFTADTNAALVILLNKFAEVEQYFGEFFLLQIFISVSVI